MPAVELRELVARLQADLARAGFVLDQVRVGVVAHLLE